MSAFREFYESEDYFLRLRQLNRDPSPNKARDSALISALGGVPHNLDVLDAGCGLGGFSKGLATNNRLTGVDLNEHSLAEIAVLGYKALRFDLEEVWPLEPASFDLILFGDVLEHLFATANVLTYAASVLRPGGHIAVAVPNVGYWRRRLRLLFKGELKLLPDDHIRFFSPQSLTRVAQQAGLAAVRSRPYRWNRPSPGILPLPFAWGFVSLLKKAPVASQR